MKVIFYDKMRETYKSVDNVKQVEVGYTMCNGRQTKFWFVLTNDMNSQSFKYKDFDLNRVEG